MRKNSTSSSKRVSFRMIAIVSAIFVVAAFVMFGFYMINLRESIIINSSHYILDTTDSCAASATMFFKNRLDALQRCALEAAELSGEEMQPLLKSYCKDLLFRRTVYIGRDGTSVTSDGAEPEASYRLLAQRSFEGSSVILPSSESTNDFDLYTVPVYAKDGSIVGAALGGASPDDVAAALFSDQKTFSESHYIVDVDGRILFAEKDARCRAGDNITEMIRNEGNSVKEFSAALNMKGVRKTQKVRISGREHIISYVALTVNDWTLVLDVPVDPIIELSKPMFMPSIFIVMGTLAIFAALAFYTAMVTRRAQANADEAIEDSRKLFYEDSITGSGTWQKFLEDYQITIRDTSVGRALISIDVDKFKAVNDLLGLDGGNTVLKQISEIIGRNIGKTDIYARSSADRFYILAGYEKEDDLSDLAERIISDIEYQVTAAAVTVSIGIYPIADRGINPYTASDRADLARGSAKGDKESTYQFFSANMLESIRNEHYIENIMDAALERREFMVYLQPKFGLGNANDVTGAEALVRWKHEGRLIPPGEFIPLFERNGFVTKLDFYMFREVCRVQKKWLSQGRDLKIISVNMSRAHLHDPNFVSELTKYCREFDIDPKYFEIEITESAAFENIDILMSVFTQIKDAGFHVSIDDFGTGYSSLNMLKDLPVDVLKIDRSFLTEDANEHENASKIIGCVVSLATSLNISTICEGIETKEQANLLSKLGCNMAQGFFFARPMPIEEFEKLVYADKN